MFTAADLALLFKQFPSLTFSHPESWCMVARNEDRGCEVQVIHHYDGGPYHVHYMRAGWFEGTGTTLDEALTNLCSKVYHREPASF